MAGTEGIFSASSSYRENYQVMFQMLSVLKLFRRITGNDAARYFLKSLKCVTLGKNFSSLKTSFTNKLNFGKRKRCFRHLKGLVEHSLGMREHKSKACKFKSKLRKIEPQILVQAALTKWEREPGFEFEVVTFEVVDTECRPVIFGVSVEDRFRIVHLRLSSYTLSGQRSPISSFFVPSAVVSRLLCGYKSVNLSVGKVCIFYAETKCKS